MFFGNTYQFPRCQQRSALTAWNPVIRIVGFQAANVLAWPFLTTLSI
jgi:hypothetical protein